MKALVKYGKCPGIKCLDVEKPQIKKNEVLIRIYAAAICGTDMDYYEWGEVAKTFTKGKNITFPFTIGHECAGIIVEVGEEVKERKVGDRVAVEPHIPCCECYLCKTNNKHNCLNMRVFGIDVNGGFAEYAVVDAIATYKIPDYISFSQAALLEPAGVSMNAIDQSDIHSTDIALVNGCGPIGLLLILLLRSKGITNIIAVDRNENKLQKAKELGAYTVNLYKEGFEEEVKEKSKAHAGVDVVFETSGSCKAYPFVFDIARKEGKIITIGHPKEKIEVDIMRNINTKGLMIKGIFGRRIWDSWNHLAQMIQEKGIDLADIVSEKYHIDDFEKAFKNAKTNWGKTVFEMEIANEGTEN